MSFNFVAAINEDGVPVNSDFDVLFYTPRHQVIKRIMNRVASNALVQAQGIVYMNFSTL